VVGFISTPPAMLRRSARIRAREAAVSADDFPSQNCDDVESDELWCCCRRGEDGRLMLCCDRQCEGCYIWFHYDCLGLSLAEAQDLGASNVPFICPQCSDIETATISDATSVLVTEQNSTVCDYLTTFKPCTDFLWNDSTGEEVCRFLISAYEEVVHWKPNIFLLPFGKAGKSFVRELARLYQAFADNSALSSIALLACSVMQPLLLQKPHRHSRAKDHSAHLLRRLELWSKGSFDALLTEGRCIQDHLRRFPPSKKPGDQSRLFDHLMSEGKVSMALRLLTRDSKGGVLSLDSMIPCGQNSSGQAIFRSAKDVLLEKHPSGLPPKPSVLLNPPMQAPCYDPVLFECLTGEVIKRAALHTHGAAGPSGVDAYCWRRMCTSYKEASAGLCSALASVARYLCTTLLEDPTVLMPFIACRLIPLDKNPGVRPIGIGDVPRRIVAKATLFVIGEDIISAAGPLQTCAGHAAGSEAAIHAMKELFDNGECEAALLVDASNAFNCINRQAALHNISVLCPSFSTILQNTYSTPVRLFIVGEGEIPSLEGTTQGDPLAMAMYALAVVPLIGRLRSDVPDASQVWFADDATAVGSLSTLLTWWQHLSSFGPDYGYFTNATKTVLIVKPEHLSTAQTLFACTNIQITARGQRHLGAALGSREFADEYVISKIESWTKEVFALAEVAANKPHAAYCAFTHGMIGRWVYLMRTIPGISSFFQPLEDAIHLKLLPVLTGHSAGSSTERSLMSLPCRYGGLGIVNPTSICDSQYAASQLITGPLKDLIVKQSVCAHPPDTRPIRAEVHQSRRVASKERAEELRSILSPQLQRAVDLNSEPGASSWLLALPLQDQGFHLTKQEFWDALHLRYGWTLLNTPSHCVCGANFTADHAMICRHGGLTFIRHNELRDITAQLLSKVCSDVSIEPPLQPLSGERLIPRTANQQDDARADIHARGFWRRQQSAFFDVRVFHPNAPSYRKTSISSIYRRHELQKKREYGDRIREVELASFTPLVFSTTGGMGREGLVFYRRLAELLSRHDSASYSRTLAWLRSTLSFSLLRSATMCIRGSRSISRRHPDASPDVGLVGGPGDY